jgi:hypothetical protein
MSAPPGVDAPTTDPGPRARRQLGRVLLTLGVLDLAVLVFVCALALTRSATGLTIPELLAAILAGVGVVLGIRIWMAVRLRARSGDLR